ncbi:type I restriction-modification system subunit M N-terminal domain-containing protein [Lacticaseibacillus thailandensis]|uniref:type I restriction-modification system subunit M N-terminal domain-containing protein n=1 Tax=Lacticaseibacillus thailandensis TaxID=381741 RepID=UPI000A68A8D3
MANSLRGTMTATQYQDYILGFMFYRYLSDHQEDYLVNEDVIDVAEGQSVNAATQPKRRMTSMIIWRILASRLAMPLHHSSPGPPSWKRSTTNTSSRLITKTC